MTVPPSPEATVWDIVTASPDLSELREAIERADLVDVVDGEEPITLFAPGNAAFELVRQSPGGDELLDDPERIRELLERHILSEALTAGDIFDRPELATIGGDTLPVDQEAELVDGAALDPTDIEGANGFLHVVDRVLVP